MIWTMYIFDQEGRSLNSKKDFVHARNEQNVISVPETKSALKTCSTNYI